VGAAQLIYTEPGRPLQLRSPNLLHSTVFFGVALFLFSAAFPPLDDAAEVNLTVHMAQHVLIILSGVAIAYPLVGRRLVREGKKSALPWLAFLASATVIAYWHLPVPWDSAITNPLTHLVEHLSFLSVGLLAGSWLLLLSDSGKIGALLAAFFGHMGYAVILVVPSNFQVYPLFSIADQQILGWVLLLTGPSFLVGVAYVIARNPGWLGGTLAPTLKAERKETFLNRRRVPRWVAPVLILFLILTAVGYFSLTAYALGTQVAPTSKAVVYIEETPVTWQFSPKNITVVLGVNSTVTWVSHSISYDTVTGRGGTGGGCGTGFSSCPIAPGQSFTYTFETPGTYQYYCEYHPWMVGSVTVIQ
jgi:plastocyanin